MKWDVGSTPVFPVGDVCCVPGEQKMCVPKPKGCVKLNKWTILNKNKICLPFRVWLEIKKIGWHCVKKPRNNVGTAVQEGKGSKAQKRSRVSELLLSWRADACTHPAWGRSHPQPLLPTQWGIGGNDSAKPGITNVLFWHYTVTVSQY